MPESRNYDLKDFDTVVVSMGVRAVITTGGDFSVRAEARDATTLDRLEVGVVGGRLSIGFARNFADLLLGGKLLDMILHGMDFNVTVYVGLPTLNGVEASSGGRIEASNVKSDRFRADASSGGLVTLLALSGRDVRADASSGARIEVEGAVTDLDASVSSGALLRLERLTAARGRLEASSGGKLEATVTTRLRANASSGGLVEVAGRPQDRDVNSSSGGRVDLRAGVAV